MQEATHQRTPFGCSKLVLLLENLGKRIAVSERANWQDLCETKLQWVPHMHDFGEIKSVPNTERQQCVSVVYNYEFLR